MDAAATQGACGNRYLPINEQTARDSLSQVTIAVLFVTLMTLCFRCKTLADPEWLIRKAEFSLEENTFFLSRKFPKRHLT